MVKILLVEDQPSLRRLVGEVLEFSGYQVAAVGDANTALDMLRSGAFCPDLILSDLMLESLSGADLLDAVRSEWLWHDIAFILMSGQDQIAALGEELKHDVDGYITKPFGIKEILASVQKGLARHERMNNADQRSTPGDSERFA